MIRVPQTEASMSEKDEFPLPGSAPDSGQPAGLAPIAPVATPNADVIPDPTLAARQAQLDDAAGIVRADDGTARNRADATRDPDGIQLTPSDAYISSKTAKVKLKQKSLTQLDELGTPVDPESEEGAGTALPIAQQQQEQVAGLAETALAEVEQATDPETRTALEEQATQVVETHDAAAKVEADRIRKTQAKQAAVEAVSTTVDYAARLYEEPEARARQIVELDEDIEELGALEGWSEPQIVEEQRKARAQVHEKIVDRLIATDPQRARHWLDAEAGALTQDQLNTLSFRIDLQVQSGRVDSLNEQYRELDETITREDYFAQIVDTKQFAALTPEQQSRVRSQINAGYNSLQQAQTAAAKQRHRDVSDQVNDGVVDPENIKKLNEQEQIGVLTLKYENDKAALTGTVRETTPGTYVKLFGKGIGGLLQADLTALRPDLSEDDYLAFIALKEKYRSLHTREKRKINLYFTKLSDIAAQGINRTESIEILQTGVHEFLSEMELPHYSRQAEILAEISAEHKLRPSIDNAPSDEGEKQDEIEQADPPASQFTQEDEDHFIRDMTVAFGLDTLAAAFGFAETDLREMLKRDHISLRENFPGFFDNTLDGKSLQNEMLKLSKFVETAGAKLARDFIANAKANPQAIHSALKGIGHLVEEGPYLSNEAREGLERMLAERMLASLYSERALFDTIDKLGKAGGRSVALLGLSLSAYKIIQSDFDGETIATEVGASAGGAIGASIGAMLAGICGPAIILCVLPAMAVGSAVGSAAGEAAGGSALNWIEDDALPFIRGLIN